MNKNYSKYIVNFTFRHGTEESQTYCLAFFAQIFTITFGTHIVKYTNK